MASPNKANFQSSPPVSKVVPNPLLGGAGSRTGPGVDADDHSARVRESIRQAELALQHGNAVLTVHHYHEAIESCIAWQKASESSPRPTATLRWLHAHRGDAWARIGGWNEAEKDFELATANSDYAWAWAHWGDMLRLKARDDEQTREDRSTFLRTVSLALEHFDKAIERRATEAAPSPESDASQSKSGSPTGSSHNSDVYGWAHAHRAATGVLIWLYYVGDEIEEEGTTRSESKGIPQQLLNGYVKRGHKASLREFVERVHKDFAEARKVDPDEPWRDQFEALWYLLTSAGKDERIERAEALAGRALLTGASSFALEAGMVFAALFAFGDSTNGTSKHWFDTAQRRTHSLLRKDPTNAIGHASLAAMYRRLLNEVPEEVSDETRTAYERGIENSLEVLRANRDLLDELIVRLAPPGEPALATEPSRRRRHEVGFIGNRLQNVLSSR